MVFAPQTVRAWKSWFLVFFVLISALYALPNWYGDNPDNTPQWLRAIGAEPLKLGLDLRGGVHLLIEVDVEGTLKRRNEGFLSDIRSVLRDERHHYRTVEINEAGQLRIVFENVNQRDLALPLLKQHFPELSFSKLIDSPSVGQDQDFSLVAELSQGGVNTLRQETVEQTMTILRNRINELGVAESVVHRQGLNHIVVELPGVQDTARAKEILGKTATLEFVMHDAETDPLSERVPVSSRLVLDSEGRSIVVKRRAILTGDSITGAIASRDSRDGMPSVSIRIGGAGVGLFKKVTRESVGKRMAVIYRETRMGENHQLEVSERVISLATIQSALGSQFQITGLGYEEANNLALMLRAGALPAAVSIVEERTVGPSLGQENIRLGILSMEVGLALVFGFMVLYYSAMGMVANVALLMNTVVLLALQSFIGATLTLPGIAGIVLTMGMAVDANVLIFERIREEMRKGGTLQASISSGFDRAFSTILDSNLTTLIAGVVLFMVGAGPVRGFAVTLSLGIVSSLLTMVMGTRIMVDLLYGRASVKKIHIGI